jgi:DNA-binding NarL/FixJ family response regulator
MLRVVAAAYSAVMDSQANATSAARHIGGTSIFLVEDSSIIRERLLQMLEAMPAVRVLGCAECPTEAIEQISIKRPDVVILDIKLTGGSGIQVLQAVKRQTPGIVVVMLTNYATPQFRSRCMQAGADYFLDKTNEFQNIASILERQNCRHAQ